MDLDDQSSPLIETKKEQLSTFLVRLRALCTRTLFRSKVRSETRQLKPTAYLDGLRGFSALLVYLHHHLIWAHPGLRGQFVLENTFGYEHQYYFACFPIIRIFFSGGNSAVAIFFLISGYVLSVSPVRAIHSNEPARLRDCLSSALFRRWIRLFLPVLATTFIWMTSWHVLGIRSHNPIAKQPEETYGKELWHFYRNFRQYSFIFSDSFWNDYNDHQWSIPLEFRGSVLVWITLLAFSQSTFTMRLCLEAGMVFYFTYIVDGWYCACFLIGLLLCEIDALAEREQLPKILSRLRPRRNWIYYLLMLIGMYLLGVTPVQHYTYPKADLEELRAKSPGWYFLSFLAPEVFTDYRWFYRILAGTMIMVSIPQIQWLQQFFENRLCQFLGRVSFGLYLVHGPILWSIGDRVYAAVGLTDERHLTDIPAWMNVLPLSDWGIVGLEINYLVAQLFLLPFTLWVALVVTKAVDDPSVKLARRLHNFCLAS